MTEQNPPRDIDDDAEGHKVMLDADADAGDDTEGHKVMLDADAGNGDDDTEGHRLHH